MNVIDYVPPVYRDLTILAAANGDTDLGVGVHQVELNTEASVGAVADLGYMLDHWLLDSVDVGSVDPIVCYDGWRPYVAAGVCRDN